MSGFMVPPVFMLWMYFAVGLTAALLVCMALLVPVALVLFIYKASTTEWDQEQHDTDEQIFNECE